MRFTEDDYEYLKGTKFSSGYRFQIEGNTLYSRTGTIINIVKGKSVIHVGCCDHISLIEKKIKEKSWLHGLLEEHCREVLGIDINEEAVDYVNEKGFSRKKVYCTDITSSDFIRQVPKRWFEYVLLGEIVEHLNNPVSFLEAAKRNMEIYGFKGKYIITVPNAFCFLRNPVYSSGVEHINSDHRYWFTPYTIAKVMVQSGILPEELYFVNYAKDESAGKSYCGDQIIVIGQ